MGSSARCRTRPERTVGSQSQGERCAGAAGGTNPLHDNGGRGRTVRFVTTPPDSTTELPEAEDGLAEQTVESASSAQGRAGWRVLAGLIAAVGAFALLGLALADSGRVRLSPGPTYQVSYKGETPSSDVSSGGWWMTTISVSRLNWAEATWQELLGSPDVIGTTAPVGSTAGAEMLSAKQTAALVAESLLAGGVTDQQLVVVETLPNSAADRIGLQPGDRIISVDGLNATGFSAILDALEDGGNELYYLRNGAVELASLQGLIGPGEKLGVRLVAIGESGRIDGELIETDEVGGSSGGLMFTLALLDAFTDGDLTGGLRVAGTGSIRADGNVGAILGAGYKFRASAQDGFDVFFVPRPNLTDLPRRDGIEVVVVDDIWDALQWLCSNGGSSSLCESTP
jgi:PDZ domain-containing protein